MSSNEFGEDGGQIFDCPALALAGKGPFLRAAGAQPAERGFRIGEDTALVAARDRGAVAPDIAALDGDIAADRALIKRRREAAFMERRADRDGRGEIGTLVEPAIERREADGEVAGEIPVLGAQAAQYARLPGEFGFVAGRACHFGALRCRGEMLNQVAGVRLGGPSGYSGSPTVRSLVP